MINYFQHIFDSNIGDSSLLLEGVYRSMSKTHDAMFICILKRKRLERLSLTCILTNLLSHMV